MKQPTTIAVVGAPASGKSTTAAILYAELMKLGAPARLVMEYATAHLGAGGKIETVEDQMFVTHQQMHLELSTRGQNFNPIVCDGAVWLGEIYMNLILEKFPEYDRNAVVAKLTSVNHYMQVMNQYKFGKAYDYMIFCPLIDDVDHLTQHRIHNSEQSQRINGAVYKIVQACASGNNCHELSTQIAERDRQIKDLALIIYNKMVYQEQKVANA